jgi:hypothetical protein
VIDVIAPSDNLYVISQQLLAKDNADPVDIGNLTFSNLMANPSGFGLTFRIAQTEMLTSVNLKALLEFIKQGGTLSELDPADVTRFTARMGKVKANYRYLPLGIRRLSVGHLLSILDIGKEQVTRRAFLQTSLE